MKDVSKQTLEQLITFIYCGEVNVGKENVTEFLRTAKELKIKGFSDGYHEYSSGSRATDVTGTTPVFNGRQYQSTQTSLVDQPTNADFSPAPSDFGNLVHDYGISNEVESPANDYDVYFDDQIGEIVSNLDGAHGNIYGINSQHSLLGQQNHSRGDFILNGARDDGLKLTKTKRCNGEIIIKIDLFHLFKIFI